jgi:molybdopterin synthase catalytic subunit
VFRRIRIAMSEIPLFAIATRPLDAAALGAAVQAEADRRGNRHGSAGALTSFVGFVRAHNAGREVERLEYEAYEPLVVRAFERIADEARDTWGEVVVGIHHRIGVLTPGEASVVIAAASPHRPHAFAACRFAIERIKQIAPIWKREHYAGGQAWIEGALADPDDDVARQEALRRACA